MTENFTPLPDPGPAYQNNTMVVVNMGEQYVVWDPVLNQYATITNAGNSQNITFPCGKAELDHWLNSTTAVNSSNLYDNSVQGESHDLIPKCDAGTCGSCSDSDSQVSALSSCGTQLLNRFEISRNYCFLGTGNGDDQTSDHTSQLVMEAKDNELLGSYNMTIRDGSGFGSTCARTKKTVNSSSDAELRVDSSIGYRNYQSDTVYTIHTPLGAMTTDISLKTQSRANHFDFSDNLSYEEYIADDAGFITGVYTDTAIVQIFYCQYIKANRSRPCAFWLSWAPGPRECAWEDPAIENRVMSIQAQADVFADATSVDPTGLQRNGAFEQALLSLINQYNSVNGIGPKQIGGSSFVVSFRQPL